jgi:hypothetical protein
MQTASDNLAEFLRKSLRQQMNELADHIAGGGCVDFSEYKRCCGVIEGLARAERELLDLTNQIDDD